MTSQLDEVLVELRRLRGIDLSGYRRDMLERRLAARMAQLRCNDPAKYLKRLRTDPSECDHPIDTIAINVSSFFRTPIVWEIISQSVLPEIIERKRRAKGNEIRVWSAGCAAGEEAYSIAILMHRALKGELANWRLHVFATDINTKALQAAAEGIYSREKLDDTKLGILGQYFTARDHGYETRSFIREMVRFSRDDLTSPKRSAPADSIFGTFDLVLCRNVLIYFSSDLQDRVLDKLPRSLAPSGYLVLGKSESLGEKRKSRIKEVGRHNRIFQRCRQ